MYEKRSIRSILYLTVATDRDLQAGMLHLLTEKAHDLTGWERSLRWNFDVVASVG
jgi:hypothetical protein